jgi:L-threonylcarbamoyladenylate synthase
MRTVSFEDAIFLLKKGQIGVLPTDTLYGLVASAMDRDAVERVYRARGRDEGKPCIVLIADVADIGRFIPRASLSNRITQWLEAWWPGKVSVILPCLDERFAYLHRGTNTIAFRVPDKPELCNLLLETGPLIAPSANPQGMKPAETADEARTYFDGTVDFLADGGRQSGEPSTVVRFEDGKPVVVREGAAKIPGFQ